MRRLTWCKGFCGVSGAVIEVECRGDFQQCSYGVGSSPVHLKTLRTMRRLGGAGAFVPIAASAKWASSLGAIDSLSMSG